MADENRLLDDRKVKEEAIKQFRLMDDTFMSKVFEDKKCAELLLRVILNKDDLTVRNTQTQFEIRNLQGRSARLDIYAVDSDGVQYDVEVQRRDSGAIPKRGRYNCSLMDANATDPGDDFENLPRTYVIFITESDYFKGGQELYEITRCVKNMGHIDYEDESCIIYVNGQNRDDTAIGRLMHDFFCTNPHEMFYDILSERTQYFKESKEGVDNMCKIMEDYAERRAKLAAEERSIGIALELWNDGFRDFEKIAKLTKLPLSEVKKLFEGKTA